MYVQEAAALLQRFTEELNYDPHPAWQLLLLELLCDHGIGRDAARRILETLATLDRPKPAR